MMSELSLYSLDAAEKKKNIRKIFFPLSSFTSRPRETLLRLIFALHCLENDYRQMRVNSESIFPRQSNDLDLIKTAHCSHAREHHSRDFYISCC